MISSRHIAPVNYWGLTKQVGPWRTTTVDQSHEALGYDSPHNQVQEVRPYQQDGSKAPTYEQVEIVSVNNINGLRGPGLRRGKLERDFFGRDARIAQLNTRIAKTASTQTGDAGSGGGGGGPGQTIGGVPGTNVTPPPDDSQVPDINRLRPNLPPVVEGGNINRTPNVINNIYNLLLPPPNPIGQPPTITPEQTTLTAAGGFPMLVDPTDVVATREVETQTDIDRDQLTAAEVELLQGREDIHQLGGLLGEERRNLQLAKDVIEYQAGNIAVGQDQLQQLAKELFDLEEQTTREAKEGHDMIKQLQLEVAVAGNDADIARGGHAATLGLAGAELAGMAALTKKLENEVVRLEAALNESQGLGDDMEGDLKMSTVEAIQLVAEIRDRKHVLVRLQAELNESQGLGDDLEGDLKISTAEARQLQAELTDTQNVLGTVLGSVTEEPRVAFADTARSSTDRRQRKQGKKGVSAKPEPKRARKNSTSSESSTGMNSTSSESSTLNVNRVQAGGTTKLRANPKIAGQRRK